MSKRSGKKEGKEQVEKSTRLRAMCVYVCIIGVVNACVCIRWDKRAAKSDVLLIESSIKNKKKID